VIDRGLVILQPGTRARPGPPGSGCARVVMGSLMFVWRADGAALGPPQPIERCGGPPFTGSTRGTPVQDCVCPHVSAGACECRVLSRQD
jgi:hypothetical protein